MRKIIISVIGILLLCASYWLLLKPSEKKMRDKDKMENNGKVSVDVQKITLKEKSENFFLTGKIIPKVKHDISLTIGGQIMYNSGRFKSGVAFKKGDLIIAVDPSETLSKLKSQKSSFVKLLSTVVPDLSIDYPEIYDSWQIYLVNFDINGALKKLPETLTNQQRLFLSGRGIYTSYYALEELIALLQKHRIYAPFNGVLTETYIDEGTMVSPNKLLGEFIFTGAYEIETSMPLDLISSLKKGKNYVFSSQQKENKKTYSTTLVRINDKVDDKTQSVRVFFESKNKDLKVGMSLSARIEGKDYGNIALIPESSFVDDSHVFLVIDGKAKLTKVNIVFREEGKVATNSLKENDFLITEKKSLSFEKTPVNTTQVL